jgi:exodeoxyribonuclease VII small subunit
MSEKKDSFESKILELESLVQRLEDGNIGLEESKEIYKQGIKIAKKANDMIKKTELEINSLKEELDNQLNEPQD